MNIIEKINKQKEFIVTKLYDWAETFIPENIFYNKNTIDEEDEIEKYQSYEFVCNLAEKLENNNCNQQDYENIIFHIDQINYNEIKIKL